MPGGLEEFFPEPGEPDGPEGSGLGGADPAEDADPDPLHVADPPLAECVDDFYSPSQPPSRLRPRPADAGVPTDILLRALEPPAIKVRHITLADILRPAYRTLGEPAQQDGRG